MAALSQHIYLLFTSWTHKSPLLFLHPQLFCLPGKEASSSTSSGKGREAAGCCDSCITLSAKLGWRWSWFVCPESYRAWPGVFGWYHGSWATCSQSFPPFCGGCWLLMVEPLHPTQTTAQEMWSVSHFFGDNAVAWFVFLTLDTISYPYLTDKFFV